VLAQPPVTVGGILLWIISKICVSKVELVSGNKIKIHNIRTFTG
jgi:hypothetical protein